MLATGRGERTDRRRCGQRERPPGQALPAARQHPAGLSRRPAGSGPLPASRRLTFFAGAPQGAPVFLSGAGQAGKRPGAAGHTRAAAITPRRRRCIQHPAGGGGQPAPQGRARGEQPAPMCPCAAEQRVDIKKKPAPEAAGRIRTARQRGRQQKKRRTGALAGGQDAGSGSAMGAGPQQGCQMSFLPSRSIRTFFSSAASAFFSPAASMFSSFFSVSICAKNDSLASCTPCSVSATI